MVYDKCVDLNLYCQEDIRHTLLSEKGRLDSDIESRISFF